MTIYNVCFGCNRRGLPPSWNRIHKVEGKLRDTGPDRNSKKPGPETTVRLSDNVERVELPQKRYGKRGGPISLNFFINASQRMDVTSMLLFLKQNKVLPN